MGHYHPLDSNHGPLVLEATTLPTEPQKRHVFIADIGKLTKALQMTENRKRWLHITIRL